MANENRTKIIPPFDVTGEVEALPSGLQTGGRYTDVTVTDAGWTALPALPLTDRNQINIQNETNFDIKIGHTGVGAYAGMTCPADGERQYRIKDSVVIYARAEAGAGSITIGVEELA